MLSLVKRIVLVILLLESITLSFGEEIKHPNVVLIITDDQGYGDVGINGNPYIKTPMINKLAGESTRFNHFYVSPVCAPTRSSLMTGRYSLRTGVRDTYNGGAIMSNDEITIAEMLKQANYTTGIFGKWHLGDNYPSRPIDQGFDESVIHLSGGMGQVGDITTYDKKDSSYFNPVLWHNGYKNEYKGYCSDIFTAQAIDFIEKNQQTPFFCYLSFNAPHTPLQVPDPYYRLYKDLDPSSGFEHDPKPFSGMSEKDKEDARKVYGMVMNIDDNIGKLFNKLDELKLAKNTIIIFMTDNGAQQKRFSAGLRALKGSVYEGGIRVPFYLKYPELFEGNKDIETAAAHIDILPTLAQLCHVAMPEDRIIDGKSLIPLIKGESIDWTNRALFFYWSRRHPELYNNMALRKGRYKLVGHTDYNPTLNDFELFDIDNDPFELNNIALVYRTILSDLKSTLDHFITDLMNSENLKSPPRITVGSNYENPVILNRNDADGQPGIWDQEEIYGMWKVRIIEGKYNIKFKFIKPVKESGQMIIETKYFIHQVQKDKPEPDFVEMKNVYFPQMDCDFVPYYLTGTKRIFPFWVELEKIE